MLFTLFRSYAIWFLISFGVGFLGLVLTLIFAPFQAQLFFASYFYFWNGLLVATAGFGALSFAISTQRNQFHFLVSEILDLDEIQTVLVFSRLDQLYSFKNKQLIAIPIFLAGAFILYICGYPMTGFPKFYLWMTSSFMFYAGGLMLAYAVYSLRVFQTLEENSDRIRLKDNVNIVELENFNLYLSVLFLAATVALYFAFRGTLTANFTFVAPHQWIADLVSNLTPNSGSYTSVRNLLIYPMVVFLPLSLFASFYVKLVIRRIYLNDIRKKVEEIDALAMPAIDRGSKDNPELHIMEVRKAALELKGKIIENNKILPLITLKDAPSIALLIIVFVQFVWINDGQVKSFFDTLISATN